MTDKTNVTLVTTKWVETVQKSLIELVAISAKMAEEITALRARVAVLELEMVVDAQQGQEPTP